MNPKAVSNNFQDAAKWIGRKLSSPHQRALQGVAALAIQPIIEYKNKDVDDDTRAVATARIIGKVFSGVLVGVIVRAGCIALMGRFAKTPSADEFARLAQEGAVKGKKFLDNLLAPSVKKVKELINNQGKNLDDIYSDHRKGMGTLIGTLVGMYTNFAVDVPITEWMTDKLTPVMQKKIENDNKKAGKIPMTGNAEPMGPKRPDITPIDGYFLNLNEEPSSMQGGARG